MSIRSTLTPARGVLNPVLSDEVVIDLEGPSTGVFLTPSARRLARHMDLIVAAAAGVCLAAAWGIRLADGPKPLESIFTLLAFCVAGVPAIQSVWRKIAALRIDVDVLMLLGAGLAAYIGSPFEGALLLFLFALSGGLESMTLRRTQSAIAALRDLTPAEATLVADGEYRRVPLRQVPIGARILVKPGEKLPLDGIVTEGNSSVDESAITGESMPRDCRVGDEVFCGTQNLDGRLVLKVTKLAGDTTLAKVIRLVTEAKQTPARAQRLIDRIGPTYSLVVICGAVLVVFVAWSVGLPGREAWHRGIAALIVASPCALIIATPVAYLAAIAAAARRGVLIKGGAHLETVARASAIAFDKTGTLTTGNIRLADVIAHDTIDETEALRLAGALSESSTHPLSQAVKQAAEQRGLTTPGVEDYRSLPGEGVEGTIEGRAVWLGRPEAVSQRVGADLAAWIDAEARKIREAGKTASVLAADGAAAVLGFEDTVRDGSEMCVQRLREQGVARIEMLTGDHETVAGRIATRLKLDGYQAALQPQDKVTGVKALKAQYGSVCLVGDGINDAPALTHADAGVAMGGMGAEIAMEAADIVLMNDRIEAVAWLHQHALRTASVVRQNLGFAIGVIAVLSVFAVLGHVPLPLAVLGHEGSTVVVALNALRLLRSPAS